MRTRAQPRFPRQIRSTVTFSAAQDAARELIAGHQRYSCLVGGTRSGKTFILTRAIIHRALRSAGSRHAILRRHANAAKSAISQDTFPKVMKTCFPGARYRLNRQSGYFKLANGSEIWVGGLDDKDRVEKILGLEFVTVFLNEASQIPYPSALIAFTRLAQVAPGLKQRAFIDLNPVGKTHWTNLLFGEGRDPIAGVPLANPNDYRRAFLNPRDNAHNLSSDFLVDLANLPERQRKRFLEGVYVDEIDGALWSFETIAAARCSKDDIPEDGRTSVVVAVDPSGASGRNDANADETGIVVAARGVDSNCYILDDRSCREAPVVWARAAVKAFHDYRADCIIAESNFGGEMVRATIQAADPNAPVRLVTASRGKSVRAEPISLRYAQGQVRHAGRFPELEDQLCAFAMDGYRGCASPDRADAAIWALTYLFGGGEGTGILEFYRRAVADGAGRPAETAVCARLQAPAGVSMAYGRSGARYLTDASGVVAVDQTEDVEPLRAAGFTLIFK